ncbi:MULTISPECIES: LysE family translocator [unclassified Mesorhizobium]|uniref:LysE family translocator n=1 Tax=unclassified Mesorhizobium TaxID=325217 RepID=UPI000FD33B14|nr:LysE family translocator [Mesorhizobium sp. M7A.F.Ca.US.010.02.1.1]RUW91875.1 LysE family translocator [Mesorhizobium sp. M7A.F.Ca.US.010.02.1.1]
MQMPPGPDSMLVMARGIGQGRDVALFTVLGMTLGAGLVQLPLIAFGLSSLVHASPLAFNLLRWAGAAYIVWLGVRLLLSSSATIPTGDLKALRPLAAAREGMIANLSNPWPLMFMVAFLPQFVDPHRGSVTLQLVLLGATQKITGVLVLGAYALASGAAGAWVMRHPRARLWQQRLAGCLIIGLGVRMVIGGGTSR